MSGDFKMTAVGSNAKENIVRASSEWNPFIEIYKASLSSRRRQNEGTSFEKSAHHTFIVFGASGDLATKKLYPTLWWLFRDTLLPPNIVFIGYARSIITVDDIRNNCDPYTLHKNGEEEMYERFWKANYYLSGQYTSPADIQALNETIEKFEEGQSANRIFYLAVPPVVMENITVLIKSHCMNQSGWNRIILEKPHGHDIESSDQLTMHVDRLFTEDQVYRIDHYLGKEMVQNLMTIRFGNKIFSPAWNKCSIACVRITFKERIGIEARGEYFDQYGIIRDVMQNHLLQIMTLVAMEQPKSCLANDIRNAKVQVLKNTRPVKLEDVVLGQYVGDPGKGKIGYRDTPKVAKDSLQSTFAMAVLHIDNERWEGVPFILSCAKAVDQRKAEIRIQFRDVCHDIFSGSTVRNELVIRVQPNEAVYIKMMIKSPGAGFDLEESELELTYSDRYDDVQLPDAYERLILDVFCGSQVHFVREDEMHEAWKIFSPLLEQIEFDKVEPKLYAFGSRGPKEADDLLRNNNFVFTGKYKYKSKTKLVQ